MVSNCYHGFFQLSVHGFATFLVSFVPLLNNFLLSKVNGLVAQQFPKHGRLNAHGGKSTIIIPRESTFNLWNVKKSKIRIVGITHSQILEK